jgi:hypothetical protein
VGVKEREFSEEVVVITWVNRIAQVRLMTKKRALFSEK